MIGLVDGEEEKLRDRVGLFTLSRQKIGMRSMSMSEVNLVDRALISSTQISAPVWTRKSLFVCTLDHDQDVTKKWYPTLQKCGPLSFCKRLQVSLDLLSSAIVR